MNSASGGDARWSCSRCRATALNSAGAVENPEGEPIGYLLHQFSDTNPGFRAKLAIYWPAATPDELVKGHADHLMIEFNNWIRMYLQTRSQTVDLMPVALTCGL